MRTTPAGRARPRFRARPAGRLIAVLASAALVAALPQSALASGADPGADRPVTAEEQEVIDLKLANSPVNPGPLVFGAQPLQDVRTAAGTASADASCAITPQEATAMTLAPVWPEVGAGSPGAPSPMTLSRYDNQDTLYDPARRDGLFFNPGVGLWQMDSAGLGAHNTAGEAIDTAWVAGFVAPYIVDRYCAAINRGSTAPAARATAWRDWNACADGSCDNVYWRAYNSGVTPDAGVGRLGGAEPRTCVFEGVGHDCLFVDTAAAEGGNWWTRPGSGRSPVPHPFYVFRSEAGGVTREVRSWLAEDSGAGTHVTVTRPFGANARGGLTWADGAGVCDTTADRGDC
ncbi:MULTISPECIES: hypothetical protein [Nocardiopsis]|uniref:Transglycosylase SLT domain-containing protein n=1 Tax=Nocardiopsis tropica TaxID=109330 RepID=A0ABV1ZSE4_9ACTN